MYFLEEEEHRVHFASLIIQSNVSIIKKIHIHYYM